MSETSLRGQLYGMINLPLIDGYTNNLTPNELRYLSCWATDAAADVEDFHARLEAHKEGEAVFVEVQGGLDGVVRSKGCVVEVSTPA